MTFKFNLPTGAFKYKPSSIISYLGTPFIIEREHEKSVIIWTDQWLAVTYLKNEEASVVDYE